MPEPVTLYRAADGTLYESADDADRHDMEKALTRQAHLFMAREAGTQRTISAKKATQLLVAFSLAMITQGHAVETLQEEDADDEREAQGIAPETDAAQ